MIDAKAPSATGGLEPTRPLKPWPVPHPSLRGDASLERLRHLFPSREKAVRLVLALQAVAVVAFTCPAHAEPLAPKLGAPLTPAQVAAWNISVYPDGRGLPPGRGTAKEGRIVYDTQCASCHGAGGQGATAEELAGPPSKLTGPDPDKNIGTYWPYATTIFDMTKRSMPMAAPGSLTDDQVYAVTAYLLFANRIIAEDFVIDQQTLPQVKMPNRDGFDRIDVR